MARHGQASGRRGRSTVERRDALEIVRTIGEELVAAGAQAVVLMGSFARGDQGPHSDLDILALGAGPDYALEVREALLVAVSWTTVDEVEASFLQPARAGYAVQGWRDARIVRDEQGLAAALQRRAAEWDWDEMDPQACDRHVAGELCGYAEEVHKLANMLLAGNRSGAAVQRNLLATRLAVVLAVHLRLLYATENDLWALVAARMGAEWPAAQARAFGLDGEDFLDTCRAALMLYRLAADAARLLFDQRELAVVDKALAIAASVERGAA